MQEKSAKRQIYLHHTVSEKLEPCLNWWRSTPERVATAFLIDKDGTVVQCFNPEYWAYHLGKGCLKQFNKGSIGIELVNEGPLTKKNGKFYWFKDYFEYKGKNIIQQEFRGYEYWAGYTPEQINSLVQLLKKLCRNFNIPLNVYQGNEFNKELLKTHHGILSHCNVRKDKSDISPALNLKELQLRLEEK